MPLTGWAAAGALLGGPLTGGPLTGVGRPLTGGAPTGGAPAACASLVAPIMGEAAACRSASSRSNGPICCT
ncbi:hypothetical protein [Micromonospora sp. WMMD998]|uniref:hypothetical protein n=1 Tax=Micromonospora sp. WMMD998 TaxID=3016092 RepID=UPI00249CD871|nr:hypothetical protein [Micromonospora sp. WMMD998]WFE42801.1 hypothetical protein O7619_22970 [Micromonospora sp. WMMD998]